MIIYKGFDIDKDNYGYYVYNRGVECGFFHTYNEVVSAIDRFYRLKEV